MFKIIVGSEREKQDLLKASKYLHDLRNIDTDVPMVNTLVHLYMAPDLIAVEVPKE